MKRVSHANLCSMIYEVPKVDMPDPVGYPKVVQKVVDGKVVNQVEFVIDDEPQPFEYKDFALENLLASGVDLKEMRFTSLSLTAASKMVAGLESLPDMHVVESEKPE